MSYRDSPFILLLSLCVYLGNIYIYIFFFRIEEATFHLMIVFDRLDEKLGVKFFFFSFMSVFVIICVKVV